MDLCKEKESSNGKIPRNIKVTMKKIGNMDSESISIDLEKYSRDIGKMG